MKRHIFFDMDGVLTPKSHAIEFAKAISKKEDVLKLFSGSVDKKIGIEWVVKKGVEYAKGFSQDILKEVGESLPLMEGARESIEELKKNNYNPIILTNGLFDVAKVFGERIGIKNVYGNVLEIENSVITGRLKEKNLLTLKSKGKFVKEFIKKNKITKKECISVGDDLNDWFMFKECGFSILFNPSKALEKKVDESTKSRRELIKITEYINVVIKRQDLRVILPFLIPEPNLTPSSVEIKDTKFL